MPAGPERLVAGAGDIGQTMLMLLSPEGELVIACWICKESFQDRRALRRHEMSAHLSHCTKCAAKHSGKCATEPLSGQDHAKSGKLAGQGGPDHPGREPPSPLRAW